MSAQVPSQQPPQVPLFRIMFGNATLLSLVYLALGLGLELLYRVYPAQWVARFTLVLDSLPARTLELLHLMQPIRQAYAYDQISAAMLRIIFAGTTIGIIFLMALVVGIGMWLMRRFIYRRYMEL